MNKDDIIRMAREASLGAVLTHDGGEPRVWIEGADWHDELERFAALVAAHEREACAKFLESGVDLKGLAGDPQMQAFCGALLMGCAKAIRERGNS